MPPLWFVGHSVLVRIDDKEFTMGEASGCGFNCLIFTLMQSLGVICSVSYIRSELERRHSGKASQIQPGTYLELKEHWRDIVDLLGLHNIVGKKFCADDFRILCIDVNLPGHGDVLPPGNDAARTSVHIGRQNLNHFVPLIRLWGAGEAGRMHRPEQSSSAAKPASSSGAAETASSTSGGKPSATTNNTESDASNVAAMERKAAQSIPGGLPKPTSSQSNSGEKPVVPLRDGIETATWAQILLMLQKIEKEPMAKELLDDVLTLRQWQLTAKPTNKVRDAMMKLGSRWEVKQWAQGKKRSLAEVAHELDERMRKKARELLSSSVAKPVAVSEPGSSEVIVDSGVAKPTANKESKASLHTFVCSQEAKC